MDLASHPDWWSGWVGALIGGAIGAVIGSCIPLGWSALQRRRERSGEISAMHVEFYLTNAALTALRTETPRVLAPLYRLPLAISRSALPKLIGDGNLTRLEMGALIEYINRVEELNRGLERAGEAHAGERYGQVQQEYNRNCAKATELMDKPYSSPGGKPLFDVARSALFRLDPTGDDAVPRRLD